MVSAAKSFPHAYQMMFFWVGLRSVVRVSLSAGLKGRNAQTPLRTMVLVVVILTVVLFGGATSRTLEILRI
jgi:NhaP-type Na+/H+ or K+/H+ antiporter